MECGGRRWWFGGALVGPWWSFGGGLGVVESGRREGGFRGVGESDGKKGEGDLNRSRATVHLQGEQSPRGGRTFALVLRRRRGLGTNVCPCAPSAGANDRPNMRERLLPQCV
jgi:hypothetical protein